MSYTNKLVGRRLVYTTVLLQLLVAFATIPLIAAEEEEGLPPIPDAGGPYEGDEGEELIFDASASISLRISVFKRLAEPSIFSR